MRAFCARESSRLLFGLEICGKERGLVGKAGRELSLVMFIISPSGREGVWSRRRNNMSNSIVREDWGGVLLSLFFGSSGLYY